MTTKTTSVILIVGARNKASGALNSVGKSVDKLEDGVSKFADVAESANVSVAGLVDQLGLGDLSGYGQQIADIRSKMVEFNEQNVEGAKGLTAIKAGIVVAVAAISLKLGKAIGDQIFQTQKWKNTIKEATAELARMGEQQTKLTRKLGDRSFELIKLIESPEKQRKALEESAELIQKEIKGITATIKREQDSLASSQFEGYLWDASDEAKENQRQVIENAKQLRDLRQEQLDRARDETSEHKKQIDLIQKSRRFRDSSNDTLKGLKDEVTELKLGAEEYKRREEIVNALKASFKEIPSHLLDIANQHKHLNEIGELGLSGRFVEIRKLQEQRSELKRLAEEEKAKADQAIQDDKARIEAKNKLQRAEEKIEAEKKKAAADRLAEEKRISDVYQTNINSLKEQLIGLTKSKEAATAFKLELQGVEVKDAKFLGGLKGQIEKLKKLKNQSSVSTGNNTATNDRLGRGTVAAKFEKTAAVIESEQQTRIQKRMEILLEKLVDFGKQNPPKIEVIG